MAMASSETSCYTIINSSLESEPPSEMKLREDLEKGDIRRKQDALKKTITLILQGERMPSLLMTVIRFVMPIRDNTLKKLLLIFWEVVPKYSSDNKLLQEMILVCDAYRKDLQHPNEFIRGSTLRFLCKLKEPELLEPLMPAIRACLDNRHSYVRRNAVLAIYTIFKNFEFLIPDAPELVGGFLEKEQDPSCKRNAFMMLLHVDQAGSPNRSSSEWQEAALSALCFHAYQEECGLRQTSFLGWMDLVLMDRALAYLSSCIDQVNSFGEILQLVIVELIYKVCISNPGERARFIRCIYNLLQSSSASVRYEAAGTLVTLSSAPTAVRASATCYIDLIVKESDNNVKLIVLDRLCALRENPVHERVLQDLTMDVLRVLASTDLEVRRKTLALALDLVTSRNIEEMVLVLRKQVVATSSAVEKDETGKYRQLLVRTLHQATVRFPDVATQIIPVLMEFLNDTNELAAADVLVFIREAIQRFDNLRAVVISKLLDVFPTIKAVKIQRAALWLLGEYAMHGEDVQSVMTLLRQSLGEIPIVDDELKRAAGEGETALQESTTMQSGTVQKLTTADGTYITQSALTAGGPKSSSDNRKDERPSLRAAMMGGDFFTAAAMCTSVTKLALRYAASCDDQKRSNAFIAEAMLVMSSVLHLGKSGLPETPMNDDDADRVSLCIQVLSDMDPMMIAVFSELCRDSLAVMLANRSSSSCVDSDTSAAAVKKQTVVKVQPDDSIRFLQLVNKNELSVVENQFELNLSRALGTAGETPHWKSGAEPDLLSSSKLNKVTQLSGFSDPVYAEAYVHVNEYDIVLDVLVVNQTRDTLQNLTIELVTIGDLKLVERPMAVTIAPHDFANIKANVKVASTENGVIFGNIVYDISGAASDRNCVVLNDIHVDIMDYIVPTSITDVEFRQKWAAFEWENKVAVNTNIAELRAYLDHMVKSTNMKCLTPEQALQGDCGFLAANLYARSIFDEDALANVSIERLGNTVTGHVRIRAKSQGMALSLGDKINTCQKRAPKAPPLTAAAPAT